MGGVIEVGADIDVSLSGSVQFSAGKQGQLIPVNSWISTLKNMKDSTSEFYDANFARCRVTLDGSFEASVSVNEPFALDVPGAFTGGLVEPFTLDLFNSTAINETRPTVEFVIDLPDIGDLSNLSFGVSEKKKKKKSHLCLLNHI